MTPVSLAFEVEIEAPPEGVWPVLVEVERWPLWNRGISFATLRGAPMEPGTKLLFQVDGMRIRSTITHVSAVREWGAVFHTLGARGALQWTLVAEGPSRTRIRLEEQWEGIVPCILRGTLRRTLEVSRLHWLERLKARVEHHSSVSQPLGPSEK